MNGFVSKMILDNEGNDFGKEVVTIHKDNFLLEVILSKLIKQGFVL